MIGELLSQTPWLLLLAQGTTCLALGLIAGYLFRRRAAWAHHVLLTALLASVLMPALYLLAGRCGLGVLAARASHARTSDLAGRAGSQGTAGGRLKHTVPPEPATGLGTACPADGNMPVIGSDHPQGLPALRLPPASSRKAIGPPPLAAETGDESPPADEEGIGEGPVLQAATTVVPWGRVAVSGWVAATVLLLLRLVLRFGLGWRIVRTARPLEDGRLRRALEMAKERLGVAGSVRIRGSDKIRSPVIWCWSGEPVLLVPEDAGEARSDTDWVGVFCHELAHWKRLDHFSGLFTEVLTAVFPWHPLLWRAKGRLLALSEQVCDDWVLATGQVGVDYAQALLDLAPGGQAALVPTIVGKEKAMKERIRRIVQNGCGDPRMGIRAVVAVSAVALLASVGVALAQRNAAPGPREREGRESPEARERRDSPERIEAQRREAVERMLGQLSEQIRDKEAALRERGDRPDGQRQTLQFELELLREMAERLEARLRPDQRGPERVLRAETRVFRGPGPIEEREVIVRTVRPPEFEARANELRRHREELAENARAAERELKELRPDQDQETQELKAHLERLHAQMRDVERQLAELSRVQAESRIARARAAQPQTAREEMRQRRDEVLAGEMRRIEQRLQDLRPDQDREAQELKAHLERLRAEMAEIDQRSEELRRVPPQNERLRAPVETRQRVAPREGRQLEAEVQELRNQLQEMREQMQQMQRLMEQMAARGPAREGAAERR